MKTKILFLLLITSLLSCNDDDNKPVTDPNLVYFLATETDPHIGESYILPLSDPEDIAEARAIIANKEKRIILAEISNDPNDNYTINKDVLRNKKWSWHITSFMGFADTSIEILDGWPSYVEEHYEEWVQNTKGDGTKGKIGFWGYTVSREVSVSELMEKSN
jgi:hypothetical protein